MHGKAHHPTPEPLVTLAELSRRGVATAPDLETMLSALARFAGARSAFVMDGSPSSRRCRTFGLSRERLLRATEGEEEWRDTCSRLLCQPACVWCRPNRPKAARSANKPARDRPGEDLDVPPRPLVAVRLNHPDCGSLLVGVCEPEEVKGLDRDTITLLDMLAPHIQSALCTRQTLTALGNEEVKGIDDLLEQFPAHVRIDTVGSRVEPSEQALSLLHRSAAKIREIGDECISRMLLAAARRFDSFPITARTQPLLPGCEIGFLDGSVRTGPETPVRTPPIGGASMSAHVTKSLVGFLHRQTNGVPASLLGGDEPIFPAEALLTPRQREVARLAMRGKTVAQIADITNIHFETVRTHLRNIYRRLGINRRSELAAMFRDKLC